jgi:myosin heavy subunit
LIKIQFNEDYLICGSTLSSYLLEKSRLIFQAPGERNFHIFYQMTRGMSPELKQKYSLREAEYYNYINKSGCYDVRGVNEAEALHEFRVGIFFQNFCILKHKIYLSFYVFRKLCLFSISTMI